MSAAIQDIAQVKDVKYTLECPYCHEQVRGNDVEHLGHRQACETIWASKSEEEKAEMERRRREAAAALPREQKIITTLDQAKRILQRDRFIGMLVRPHLQSTESGIIINADYQEGSEEYIRVFYRSQYVRVLRVTENFGKERDGSLSYPFLKEWKDALDAGGKGPVLRINGDAGIPCKGKDNVAILILHGSEVIAEYSEGDDEQAD